MLGKDTLGQHLLLVNALGAFFLQTLSLDRASLFLNLIIAIGSCLAPLLPFINIWLLDEYFFNTVLVLSFYIWLLINLPVIEVDGT